MNPKQAVERALLAFPKLYYFVPPIKSFNVDVPAENVKVLARQLKVKEAKAKTIKIKRPLDAILWLIETLTSEEKTTRPVYCPQSVVEHLASRWTIVNLTKELNKLSAAKLIISRIRPHDKRERELMLTPEGRQVLEDIKDQRREVLKLMFDNLNSDEMKKLTSGLNQVAKATWPKMKETASSRG